MTNLVIQNHYSYGGLLGRTEAAPRCHGPDPQRPTYQDLFSFEQLHERGVVATREHARCAGSRSVSRQLLTIANGDYRR